MFTVGCPKALVFSDKILWTWVKGFPLNKGVKEGYPLKRRYFAGIGSYSVSRFQDICSQKSKVGLNSTDFWTFLP